MKIIIGTPSARGEYKQNYVLSLIQTLTRFSQEGHEAFITFQAGALINRARNSLALRMLQQDADYLLMIDDDMSWDQSVLDATLALMKVETPIISVAAPMRCYPIGFPYRFFDEPEEVINGVKVKRGMMMGTGYMAVHRKVFEDMAKDAYVYRGSDDPRDAKTYRFFAEKEATFKHGPTGEDHDVLLGEDESFCMWANHLGHLILVPVDVVMGHEGSHKFEARVSDHWDTVRR